MVFHKAMVAKYMAAEIACYCHEKKGWERNESYV